MTWCRAAGARPNQQTAVLSLDRRGAPHLDICTPYFVTDESSEWALGEARRRGVRVRILVEGYLTDAKPVKYARREAFGEELAGEIGERHGAAVQMMELRHGIFDDACISVIASDTVRHAAWMNQGAEIVPETDSPHR